MSAGYCGVILAAQCRSTGDLVGPSIGVIDWRRPCSKAPRGDIYLSGGWRCGGGVHTTTGQRPATQHASNIGDTGTHYMGVQVSAPVPCAYPYPTTTTVSTTTCIITQRCSSPSVLGHSRRDALGAISLWTHLYLALRVRDTPKPSTTAYVGGSTVQLPSGLWRRGETEDDCPQTLCPVDSRQPKQHSPIQFSPLPKTRSPCASVLGTRVSVTPRAGWDAASNKGVR